MTPGMTLRLTQPPEDSPYRSTEAQRNRNHYPISQLFPNPYHQFIASPIVFLILRYFFRYLTDVTICSH